MGKKEGLTVRKPVATCVTHIYVRNAFADVIDRVTTAGHMLPSCVVGISTQSELCMLLFF